MRLDGGPAVKRLAIAVTALATLLAFCSSAGAARHQGPKGNAHKIGSEAETPTLTSFSSQARWSGSLSAGVTPDPAACTPVTCESRTVRLALRHRLAHPPAGMLVALHWPEEQLDAGYDLDLYVYSPDGKLAASSTQFQYSTDEAAWIQAPANGTYRVVVATRNQYGTSPFEVNVQFEYGRETTQATTLLGAKPWDQQLVMVGRLPRKPAPLLPDMVMAPAHNFHMETTISCGFYCGIDRGLGHPPSCELLETSGATADEPTTAGHPLRCLRFDSDLLNLGAGPFEVRAYPNKGNGTDAFQVIYNSDGTYGERRAGEAHFSTSHGHIHYQGFEDTGLYTVGPNGQPGTLVQPMLNKGRCAADTHNIRFGMPNDTPMHYVFPSTCDSTNLNQDPNDPIYPNEPYWRSGLSPGWDDEYPWFLVDTYIDVTNVPDGRYLIVTKLNTQGEILESNYANNTAIACVELKGETATECG